MKQTSFPSEYRDDIRGPWSLLDCSHNERRREIYIRRPNMWEKTYEPVTKQARKYSELRYETCNKVAAFKWLLKLLHKWFMGFFLTELDPTMRLSWVKTLSIWWGPPSQRPDCVALSRNNTTDGLSRFWVAHTLTFIIQSNELGFSIIPAINCLARSQAKFKWRILFPPQDGFWF